ncbi:recombinase family protein [Pseudomonas chengduensis]|nr:recombinase family protein [Pseudomonas chengduensis]MDH1622182.1 recombinase family protein [Pseudomonas chengduensis]
MPSAISYIRFSTSKQINSNSRQRQQEAVLRWLSANPDYALSELEFADLGVSGFHGDHIKEGGGWAKLLLAVEAGHIKGGDVVLVEAMDRTGRLPALKMLDIIRPVLEAGVSIITLDDNNRFDQESLNGPQIYLLVAKIQAAHGYSKTLSARTKASYAIRKAKAKNGESVKRWTPVWLTTDGQLIDKIVPHIKEAFDLYICGMGKTAIANRIRVCGVEELSTCSGPTVHGWLTNKTAMGYWDDIPGVYPPIVSRETFLQAQKRLEAVKTPSPQRTSKNFLVGLVKCGTCGGNYIIHHKDGKPNNMRCLNHHRLKNLGCTNNETIPCVVIHHLFSETASKWTGKALQAVQLNENEKRRLVLESEVEEITQRLQRLVKTLSVLGDSDEIVEEMRDLSDNRKTLQAELEVLERHPSSPNPNLFIADQIAEDQLLLNDPVKLNSLLKQAGYTITVYPQKLIIAGGDVLSPWQYKGTKRKGNATLGYVVHSVVGSIIWEEVLSPESRRIPTWGKQVQTSADALLYSIKRSTKWVSVPQEAKYSDHPEYVEHLED